MSNTDNMRVLAVVSTQLTYESFIADSDWGAPEPVASRARRSPSIWLLMTGDMSMTTWTAPFGPASLQIDAELETAKISASLDRLPRSLEAARRRRRAVRRHRLERRGGAVRGGARQGPGVRAAHAGARIVLGHDRIQPAARRLAGHRLDARGHLADPGGGRLLSAPRRRDPHGLPGLRAGLQVEDRAAERRSTPTASACTRWWCRRPTGPRRQHRLTTEAYLGIVAATNFKQRVRKMLEYYHADRLNYVVVGHAEPARVRPGLLREAGRRRGGRQADRPPVQVAGVRAGRVPRACPRRSGRGRRRPTPTRCRSRRRSSTSRCRTSGWICACSARTTACPIEDIAAATGLTVEQVDRVFRDIDQKRKTTEYLHLDPELADDVPEISHTLKSAAGRSS